MNLNAIANSYCIAVTPNLIGSIMASAGSTRPGDAVFTGSIAGTTLTVTAVASGTLAVNSVLAATLVQPATMVQAQLSGTTGGIGTYRVSRSQTVTSQTISATGTGDRIPAYATVTGVSMQVQAVAGDDLKHVDGLNIEGIYRVVYVNGRLQGVNRQALKGGDLLMIPTGLATVPPLNDTWLISKVIEPWDTGGWCKVLVVLQENVQSQ